MDTIEVKRKSFDIIAPIGEKSFKVERKGKTYFLKTFSNKDDFDTFISYVKRFKNLAIVTPKIHRIDKKAYRVVMQYIEGTTILDMLIKGDLEEVFYEMIFEIDWLARNDKLMLDFRPDQFIYDGKQMYYLPFRCRTYDSKETFSNTYIKLWFYTEDLVKYLKDMNLPYDEKRIGNPYEKNKKMALTAVKYYK